MKVDTSTDAAGVAGSHVVRSRAIRADLADAGVEIDRRGADPAELIERCWRDGLFDISVPESYGGAYDGNSGFALRALYRSIVDIAAIDGSAGQCYATQHFSLRGLLTSEGLAASTRRRLADEHRERCIRLVSSNSEAGTGPVTARRVDGGVVVDGTKSFNTNSGGDGYALVSVRFDDLRRGQALVPLDAPGVRRLGDWDAIGQRATVSQSIAYDSVFVPDGWHFPLDRGPASGREAQLARGFGVQAALLIGIAAGALDAAVGRARKLDRPTLPAFGTALADPLLQRRLGRLSTRVHSGLAHVDWLAGELGPASTGGSMDVVASAFRTKMACLEASLDVCSEVFELMGARSVAGRHRLDRFWRNARTFSLHDSGDAKYAAIGSWELTGEWPEGVLPQGGVGVA